jgi:hypothetical protein
MKRCLISWWIHFGSKSSLLKVKHILTSQGFPKKKKKKEEGGGIQVGKS